MPEAAQVVGRADNRKQRHIRETERTIRFILDGCSFKMSTDIDGHKVKTFLAQGRGPDGYGEATYNLDLVTFKTFVNWLWKQGRAVGKNPMVDCMKIVQTEFRKQRRAFTDDEAARLLAAAENGPVNHKVPGHERALIYRLAMETGLRAGEIRSLTVVSFSFAADLPTVHVEPCNCKGKKPADLVLIHSTAQAIQGHLAGKEASCRAFRMPSPQNITKMLRADLERAGIEYTDASGRDLDFHSLRHTFCTNLFRAGVHPAVAQKLARHSDIKLTMKYYTHVLRESEIDAINRLAHLSSTCQNGTQRQTPVDVGGRKTSIIDARTAIPA